MARFFVLAATALLVGCGGASAAQTAFAPRLLAQPQSHIVGPDTCDHNVGLVIKHVGGKFPVPPCSGWHGTINYPPTDRAYYDWVVTSSATNNFGAPPPPSGTALFYLQTTDVTRNRTTVFQNTGVTDTISSPQLTSSHTYTLNVYNFFFYPGCSGSPCSAWSANIGSPASGTHSITFTSPLNGAAFNIPKSRNVIWQFVQN